MERILIIDDCEDFRHLLHDILTEEGYDVIEAGNGAEAIGVFKTNTDVLVVTDILMPVKEGIETIMELA